MSEFSASIKLNTREPNLWTGIADPDYAHPGGRFGGWTAAALLEAARREPGERGRPLSLTVLFINAVNDGDIEISTRMLRTGARLQFWRAEMTQGETLCAHAQVTFGVRRETDSFTDAEMPAVIPPEEVTHPDIIPPVPFLARFQTRWLTASPMNLQDAGPKANTQQWVRHREGAPMDNTMLAALADFAPPRMMFHRKAWVFASTVSMTTHFHATPDELEEVGNDYILSDVQCRRAEGGYYDHELKLWSRSGKLLATSEQVAVFKD